MQNVTLLSWSDFLDIEYGNKPNYTIGNEKLNALKKEWKNLSKGHNFILMMGTITHPMYYSVEYFGKMLRSQEKITEEESTLGDLSQEVEKAENERL